MMMTMMNEDDDGDSDCDGDCDGNDDCHHDGDVDDDDRMAMVLMIMVIIVNGEHDDDGDHDDVNDAGGRAPSRHCRKNEESMVIRPRPCIISSTPPPSPRIPLLYKGASVRTNLL